MVFDKVSIDGGDDFLLQIGDAGGIEDTGYDSGSPELGDSISGSAEISTTGFAIYSNSAGYTLTGTVRLHNVTGNVWVANGSLFLGNDGSDRAITAIVNGRKALSAQLDRVRLTTDDGSDLFDGGQVAVFYSLSSEKPVVADAFHFFKSQLTRNVRAPTALALSALSADRKNQTIPPGFPRERTVRISQTVPPINARSAMISMDIPFR